MKFQVTLATFLLPLAVIAAPAAEAAEPIAVENDSKTRAIGLDELSKRSSVTCEIVNTSSSQVNCRSGPGTSYPVVAYVYPGDYYTFNCYKTGTCIEDNCTWDRVQYSGGSCYVSGYYTDSSCSAAALGKC